MVVVDRLTREHAKRTLEKLESSGVLAILEASPENMGEWRVVAFGDPLSYMVHGAWPYDALTN